MKRLLLVAAMLSAVLGIGQAAAQSPNFDDPAEMAKQKAELTATVLGGAQLLGGRGSIPATVVGGATLAAIFTLLNFLGLPNPVRSVVQGLILIGAVALAMYRRKRTGQ